MGSLAYADAVIKELFCSLYFLSIGFEFVVRFITMRYPSSMAFGAAESLLDATMNSYVATSHFLKVSTGLVLTMLRCGIHS